MSVSAYLEQQGSWQQAINIAVDMYHFTSNGNLIHDIILRDQLRKTALSVASHIAEGKERGNPSEHTASLCSAQASATTLRTLLIISREVGYLTEGEFLEFEDKIARLIVAIDQSIESLKKNP
jgi:four helix bundle protein